eukprot:10453335-Alexandrium_andersonii.AAC.1
MDGAAHVVFVVAWHLEGVQAFSLVVQVEYVVDVPLKGACARSRAEGEVFYEACHAGMLGEPRQDARLLRGEAPLQ